MLFGFDTEFGGFDLIGLALEGLGFRDMGSGFRTQRAQYPLIKEYALNYKGPYIMIYAICLN